MERMDKLEPTFAHPTIDSSWDIRSIPVKLMLEPHRAKDLIEQLLPTAKKPSMETREPRRAKLRVLMDEPNAT
jgi:hypothetical protein